MKFNKMQNKKKQTLLVLAQDRSHTMFKINNNNHAAVYVDDNPANIYLFKVNNRNARKRCETSSKLTIKTPERCQ